MKNINLYDSVQVKVDKKFLCPHGIIKAGSIGSVVSIEKNKNGEFGYLVELEQGIFDFLANEIEKI